MLFRAFACVERLWLSKGDWTCFCETAQGHLKMRTIFYRAAHKRVSYRWAFKYKLVRIQFDISMLFSSLKYLLISTIMGMLKGLPSMCMIEKNNVMIDPTMGASPTISHLYHWRCYNEWVQINSKRLFAFIGQKAPKSVDGFKKGNVRHESRFNRFKNKTHCIRR